MVTSCNSSGFGRFRGRARIAPLTVTGFLFPFYATDWVGKTSTNSLPYSDSFTLGTFAFYKAFLVEGGMTTWVNDKKKKRLNTTQQHVDGLYTKGRTKEGTGRRENRTGKKKKIKKRGVKKAGVKNRHQAWRKNWRIVESIIKLGLVNTYRCIVQPSSVRREIWCHQVCSTRR